MRKSLKWGDPATDDKGNITITYKYIALIWDKDRIIIEDQPSIKRVRLSMSKNSRRNPSQKRRSSIQTTLRKNRCKAWLIDFSAKTFGTSRHVSR